MNKVDKRADKKIHPAANSKTPAAKALYHARDSILMDWVARVRAEVKTADTLVDPVIINTIPLFLDALAEALCEDCDKETATEASNFAQEHGGERARVTKYGPEQILHEYRILKEVVEFKLEALVDTRKKDLDQIQKSFDGAIQESMISYFLVFGRMRERIIATLTHELQEPLGVIRLASSMLEETLDEASGSESIEDIRNLNDRVARGVRKANRIVKDLLSATVVDIGETVPLVYSHCDLLHVARLAIDEQPREEKARIQLAGESAKGHWDADALQQAIECLLDNALKHGDATKKIIVEVQSVQGRCMVSVRNEGDVIPAENLETLAQAFMRAESSGASAHRGLPIARKTAERLGGSLGTVSSKGSGTVFTIDIPSDSRPFAHAPTSTAN